MRDIIWVGSTLDDLEHARPTESAHRLGIRMPVPDLGEIEGKAERVLHFRRQILEVVESFDGNAYRAVYTVRFSDAVYVLHVFQKKSRHGIATPKPDLDTIARRLRDAERIHAERILP